MIQEEIARIAAALRTAIRLSGTSHRHVERELGLSTGYLTRILAGQVELRVRHVLEVCRVIGLPPDRFFAALFPHQAAPEAMSRLERGLAQLHPPAGLPAPPSGEGSDSAETPPRRVPEILRLLRQALDDLESALQ